MGMHVILLGNPGDGFRIFGPFKTFHAARDAAESPDFEFDDSQWWIMPLEAPEVMRVVDEPRVVILHDGK